MVESLARKLEQRPRLNLVQQPRFKIIPLHEEVAIRYAFNHRHEPYEDVAFVLGLTPRALQHRYERWGFSPKRPCAGHVTARQYSRFFKFPYPTVVDKLVHSRLEGRKHGEIWEIPVDQATKRAIALEERRYEVERRKRDRRIKSQNRVSKDLVWSLPALDLVRAFDKSQGISLLQKTLQEIGEVRSREAVRKKLVALHGPILSKWSEAGKQILRTTEIPADFNKLQQQLREVGEDRSLIAIEFQYRRIHTRADRRRSWTEEEKHFVVAKYGITSTEEIARTLGRTPIAIYNFVRNEGISAYDNDGWYTASELERLTGVKASTLRKQAERGKHNAFKNGKLWRFKWDGESPLVDSRK